jgi:hypothetical protein
MLISLLLQGDSSQFFEYFTGGRLLLVLTILTAAWVLIRYASRSACADRIAKLARSICGPLGGASTADCAVVPGDFSFL